MLVIIRRVQKTVDEDATNLCGTVERFACEGIRVHCFALGGVDLISAAGKTTMGVIAAVAEFERGLLIERTQSGLAREKAAGKALGRPQGLTKAQQEEIVAARAQGVSLGELVKRYNLSRPSIQRVERQALG